jgi:hypothetical protein
VPAKIVRVIGGELDLLLFGQFEDRLDAERPVQVNVQVGLGELAQKGLVEGDRDGNGQGGVHEERNPSPARADWTPPRARSLYLFDRIPAMVE